MMEELMPEVIRLMDHLKRFDPPEIRALAEHPGAQQDLRSGEGDVTLEQAIEEYPGCTTLRPTQNVRSVDPSDTGSVFAIDFSRLDLMSPSHLMREWHAFPAPRFYGSVDFGSAPS